jgi:Na+-driven multidrug efflux pump
MTATVLEKPARAVPTLGQMLTLWVPLAASTVMMVLEPSIINAGLGRTADPELALAAYGVAFSLALLVEAPILMLLDASVARSTDHEAFALIRRLTLGLGLLVTAVGLIVSLTPLYGLIVERLMNIPADVAARAQPTLAILSAWPLPIAWRRAHQGVLIRSGRTAMISAATMVRLLVLAAALFGGLLLLPQRGAVVAGVAMDMSVVAEAVVVTLAVRPILHTGRFRPGAPAAGEPPLTLRALWQFYRPLLMTTFFGQATRPLLNAGIAMAALPRASLAAWPVAWGLNLLIAGPTWSLQQFTTALASDGAAYRQVRRFALSLSLILTLLSALIAFTPLYGLVMGGVYNLSPELQDLARPATQILFIYPLMAGLQALMRGVLIRGGCTRAVRRAMMVDVAIVGAAVLLGVTFFAPAGCILAAVAVLAGLGAELAWLRWKASC